MKVVARDDRRSDQLFRHLSRNRLAAAALLVIALAVLAALAAPWLPLSDPDTVETASRLRPPGSPGHPLGTDEFGRDLLSRLVWGARVSLLAGVGTAAAAMVLGVSLGLIAGYYRGWVESLIMRFTDILMAFPFILLAIAVIGVLGPSLATIIVVIGVSSWVVYARIVRGAVLSLREREFVQAALALGSGDGRVLLRHVLPNTFGPFVVLVTAQLGGAILAEAALSFLGLGIPEPYPSWGRMLSIAAAEYARKAPWLVIYPGLAISLAVFGSNLLGDALRDTLDPRLRGA